MTSDHGHEHVHRQQGSKRALALALLLVVTYMGAEIVVGLLSGSLALLADAGHMAADGASLAMALLAIHVARRPASERMTYGYRRLEVLAALVNGSLLFGVAAMIVVEAVERWGQTRTIDGPMMLATAVGGLFVNLTSIWLLTRSADRGLNIRAALLHVKSDLLGSAQAILAGGLIWAFEWYWTDTIASILIGLLIVRSTWHLMKETLDVLMEGAPRHIDLGEVRTALLQLSGVKDAHDIHVWTVTSGFEAATAHLVAETDGTHSGILKCAQHVLEERFGLRHVTVQIEGGEPCANSSCGSMAH